MSRIFISHCSKDAWVAPEIVNRLREKGVDAWFSGTDMRAAADVENSIQEALDKSDWFAVVITPNTATRPYVKGEIDWALENRPQRIIPIMGRNCRKQDIPIPLRGLHMVNFRDDPAAALDQIANTVGVRRPVVAKPVVPKNVPPPRPPETAPARGKHPMAAMTSVTPVTVFGVVALIAALIVLPMLPGTNGTVAPAYSADSAALPTSVLFATCETEIAANAAVIYQVAAWLERNPGARLRVTGSLDGRESMYGECKVDPPTKIAERRADAVAAAVTEALRAAGFEGDRVTVETLDGAYSPNVGDEPRYRSVSIKPD
jgi:hypothetical protein